MTNVTWRQILTRIKDIIVGIDPDDPLNVKQFAPRQLDPSNFPEIVIIPGQMTSKEVSADRNDETRQFTIEVYLADARGGVEYEQEEQALSYDLLDTVPQEFYARPRLELNDNGVVGEKVRINGDTGIRQIPYPQNSDNLYLGFILTLSVTRSITQRLKRSANS